MALAARTAGLLVLCAVALSLAAPAVRAHDEVLPPHFEDLELPDDFIILVNLTFAPDGTLFVVQKQGVVRVYDASGTLRVKPLIYLADEVNNDLDRGLLGFALHPGWKPDSGSTSWVYLLYLVSPESGKDFTYNENDQYSFSRLTRYRTQVDEEGDIVAVESSRQVLLGHQLPDGTVPDGIASLHHSHSNGTLVFGADGTLLVSAGDGAHYDFVDAGGADDAGFDDFVHPVTGLHGPIPKAQDVGAFRSQQLNSLAGKVLRLDPETGRGLPSNPFYDGNVGSLRSRVWALGLRNPYRMTLKPGTGFADPAQGRPGLLYVGDVGWNTREDLNICRGGENFGWPCFEGTDVNTMYQGVTPTQPGVPGCGTAGPGVLTAPALSWHHYNKELLVPVGLHVDAAGVPLGGFTGSCALAGPVYTGTAYPAEYQGRLFIYDYGQEWIRQVDLAPDGSLLGVRDFAEGIHSPTHLAMHPVTGELYYTDIFGQRIHRLRYGVDNLTPVPVPVALTPTAGPLPLDVSWSAAGSADPDGDAITVSWDWGDGSPPSTELQPSHSWDRVGVFEVRLTVTDSLGLSATASPVLVTAGDAPPIPRILAPVPGTTFVAPATLPLVGDATDPDDEPISAWEWTADLYHNTHVHPGSFHATEPTAEIVLDLHGSEGSLIYHRIELAASDPLGAVGRTHVFVYAESDVQDLTGSMLPMASTDLLTPPGSQGPGQHDLEILRDGNFPPPGTTDPLQQFDTLNPAGDPNDVWLGYELDAPPAPEQRFIGLVFQEGLHTQGGGWFSSFHVEVRDEGVWTAVGNVSSQPAYPFELAGQPGFDGHGFDTYTLHFDPIFGDAIRLRGAPGGSAHYVTCAELRAQLVRIKPVLAVRDITDQATTILAKVFTLSPPHPTGAGNHDPEVMRDGSYPPEGSSSLIGQFDTAHGGDQGAEDWLGYAFPLKRLITGLFYKEGRDSVLGGAFVAGTLKVEVRNGEQGPWVEAPGLVSSPEYGGLDGVSYESHLLSITPTLADAVRISGVPAGSRHYTSAGELRVLAPAAPAGCEPEAYGTDLGGPHTLVLEAPDPAFVGLPFTLRVSGAQGPSPGMLMLAFLPGNVPLLGGKFLVGGANLVQLPIPFGAAGDSVLSGMLPEEPALLGVSLHFQAFAQNQPAPWPVRFSNGLKCVVCSVP